MKYRVRHLDRITLPVGGRPHYGYEQDWFPDRWQRLAGCGPTTGATMIAYLEGKERGEWPATWTAAQAKMVAFWPYATPRMHGLYKTRWLMEGLNAYLADHCLTGRADMLNIPLLRPMRPAPARAMAFIGEALAEDMPLGFLDLHNGGNRNICSWHWTPLVALDDATGQAMILDEGRCIEFDFPEWLSASAFGGGLVRILGTENKG